MNLTLGFSPCPNDTFIFDAMVHGKIDTEDLEFKVYLGDVEDLNRKALQQELDISKLSYAVYGHVSKDYVLLDSGSALGQNCGPLLIARDAGLVVDSHTKVAIPGEHTTANFLFSLAYPHSKNKKELVFNQIENAVLSGEVDAGLIIHENRFTYAEKGLKKIIDLGAWWEAETHMPIPLGGIVVKRDLPKEVQMKINRVLRKSVEYALKQPTKSNKYVKQHAQEMDDQVIRQHIELYVNDFSIDLGKEGKEAVKTLLKKGADNNIIPGIEQEQIFHT